MPDPRPTERELMPDEPDHVAVMEVIDSFFAAFASGPSLDERLLELSNLFLPGAVIVRTCGSEPTRYEVDEFIRPRRELLGSGALTDFSERATGGRVDVFGDIAQWFGGYAKSWTELGTPHTGRGMKSIQLVRVADRWRISAVAWDDERPGVLGPHPVRHSEATKVLPPQ